MEKELKIAMILDDYKLKNKAEWWVRCFKNPEFKKMYPDLETKYVFDREETGPGVTANTVSCFRYYKLKEP